MIVMRTSLLWQKTAKQETKGTESASCTRFNAVET